jgi:hypothetical protein
VPASDNVAHRVLVGKAVYAPTLALDRLSYLTLRFAQYADHNGNRTQRAHSCRANPAAFLASRLNRLPMNSRQIRYLLVLGANRVIGIVSIGDLVKLIIGAKDSRILLAMMA